MKISVSELSEQLDAATSAKTCALDVDVHSTRIVALTISTFRWVQFKEYLSRIGCLQVKVGVGCRVGILTHSCLF